MSAPRLRRGELPRAHRIQGVVIRAAHRQRESGEVSAQFNADPSSTPFTIDMAPSSGVFTMVMGRNRVPLYAALTQGLGMTDDQLEQTWGVTLTAANKRAAGRQADLAQRLARSLSRGRYKPEQGEDAAKQAIQEALAKIPLDRPVVARNLSGYLPEGHSSDKVDGHLLLASTAKLLDINRGKAEEDDRDALYNQKVMGPEDTFADRIRMDAGKYRLKLAQMVRRDPLRKFSAGFFTKQVMSALRDTRLGTMGEQVNPLEMLDASAKVVRTGEGGMSADAIPLEARNVQPSQLGLIDLVRSPEGGNIGVDVRFAHGVRKGRDGQVYQRFRMADGTPRWMNPDQMYDQTIALPHELAAREIVVPDGTPVDPETGEPTAEAWAAIMKNPQFQPKTHVLALKQGKTVPVPRAEVTAELPEADRMFSSLTNAAPGLSGIKGGRALMAGKMMTQAAPLAQAEAPLVQAYVFYSSR